MAIGASLRLGFDLWYTSFMTGGTRSLMRALLTVVGTIIGAGIFGLPSVFAWLGIWGGSLLFWFLALVVMCAHLLYAEIHLAAKEKKRLSGYAHEYLGAWGGRIAGITYPMHIIGADLIYLILGGQFLAVLFSLIGFERDVFAWQLAFWAAMSLIVLAGLKKLARIESFATWLLLAAMFASVVILAATHPLHLTTAQSFYWQMPSVGVFLFALCGLPVIGEAVDLAGKNRKRALWAVGLGTLIAAFFMWVFGVGLSLAGSGAFEPTAEALSHLFPLAFAWIIPLVGFLAVMTSYITTAEDLVATFHLDFHLTRVGSFVVALVVPVILLFIVDVSYVRIMDVVGAVFNAANALIVCLIALALFRHKKKWSWWWRYAAPIAGCVIFAFAALQKLFTF
jgi:tyrosine-specific transport protein